ncbi:hypothetical protein MY11210_007877 [Beauveria gryllotalpidicola]
MDTEIGRQPDFAAIRRHLHELGEELGLCENIPALDGGAELTRTMRSMMQQLTAVREGLADLKEMVQQGFATQAQSIELGQKNSMARMWNSTVSHRGVRLAPLYSVRTGAVVAGCPSTLERLDAMRARDVDAVLRDLGETVEGNAEAKRAYLETFLGIMQRATSRAPSQ